MSYKENKVRYAPQNGRHIVEVLCGGEWRTIAIRERRDVAMQIFEAVRVIETMTDEKAIEAEREARESETPDIKLPSPRPPSVFHRPLGP